MDNERLTGLIAFLLAHHGGGFVNNTITRDELLDVLQELQTRRKQRAPVSPPPGVRDRQTSRTQPS